jgi:ABC-type branched-subunit amino acid transport system permease subunit
VSSAAVAARPTPCYVWRKAAPELVHYDASRARDGETMALILVKLALLAGLTIITLGVFPDRRRGAVLAIATCVAAAVVLHFVAP